jgi:hypothetical protein
MNQMSTGEKFAKKKAANHFENSEWWAMHPEMRIRMASVGMDK